MELDPDSQRGYFSTSPEAGTRPRAAVAKTRQHGTLEIGGISRAAAYRHNWEFTLWAMSGRSYLSQIAVIGQW
jgi:hypothetical protein